MSTAQFPVVYDKENKCFVHRISRQTLTPATLNEANAFLSSKVLIFMGQDNDYCENCCKYVGQALYNLQAQAALGKQEDGSATFPVGPDSASILSDQTAVGGLQLSDMAPGAYWLPPSADPTDIYHNQVGTQIAGFLNLTGHLTAMQVGELAVAVYPRAETNEVYWNFFWALLIRQKAQKVAEARQTDHIKSGYIDTHKWMEQVVAQIGDRIPAERLEPWLAGLGACARVEKLGLNFEDLLRTILSARKLDERFPKGQGRTSVKDLIYFHIIVDGHTASSTLQVLHRYTTEKCSGEPQKLIKMLNELQTSNEEAILHPDIRSVLVLVADRLRNMHAAPSTTSKVLWAPWKGVKAVGHAGVNIVGTGAAMIVICVSLPFIDLDW